MRAGLLVGLLLASMLLSGCLAYHRFETAELRVEPAEKRPMPSPGTVPGTGRAAGRHHLRRHVSCL